MSGICLAADNGLLRQWSSLPLERGLVAEARIILRNLLEVLSKLRAISVDRDVARAYVQEDAVFRKKFINKFKLLSGDVKEAQGNPQLDDLLATIKKNIQEKDCSLTTSSATRRAYRCE